jgi:hypothetical protein
MTIKYVTDYFIPGSANTRIDIKEQWFFALLEDTKRSDKLSVWIGQGAVQEMNEEVSHR